MMSKLRLYKFFILLSFLIMIGKSFSEDLEGNKYVDIKLDLAKINGLSYLIAVFNNKDKWHTYWKNPGDSGTQIKNVWKKNEQLWTPFEEEWPVPKRFVAPGNIITFGHKHQYAFFYRLENDFLSQNKGQALTLDSEFLVCDDICLPGGKKISLKIPDSDPYFKQFTETDVKKLWEEIPQRSHSFVPEVEGVLLEGSEDNTLKFQFEIPADSEFKNIDFNILTPFPNSLLSFGHESFRYDSKSKKLQGEIPIQWFGVYEEPAIPMPQTGLLKQPFVLDFLFTHPKDKKTKVVSLTLKEIKKKTIKK